MKLYINTSFDARESLVVSETQNSQTSIRTLFNGDSLPLEIKFVDGLGDVDWTYNSQHLQNVKVAIGDLDQQTIVAFVDGLTQHANNFWQGTLILSTEAIASQLAGQEEKQFHFEVQVIKNSGEIVTANQSLVSVRNQLILNSTQTPSLTGDFLVSDPNASVAVGVTIKILQEFIVNGQTFEKDQTFTTTGSSPSDNSVKVTINGTHFWIGQRGVRYEIVTEPANVTAPPPPPSYNDSFVGRWVEVIDDSNRTDNLQNGDVVQITAISTNGENLISNNSFFNSAGADDTWTFTTEPVAPPPSFDDTFVGRWVEVTNDQYRTDGLTNGDVVQITSIENQGEALKYDGAGMFLAGEQDVTWQFTTAPANEAYFVWGDDGTNGIGYYYPVYLSNTGLSSYHTHTIGGVDYYMEDSVANHAILELPSDNTLPPAPNTLTSPEYVQVVYGYNYRDWSSAFQKSSTDNSYTMINPSGYNLPDQFQLNLSNMYTKSDNFESFHYYREGAVVDQMANSVYSGQNVIGDMEYYSHTFEIYKYKVTSVEVVNQSTAGGTSANRKIGIEALGNFADVATRQSLEDASLSVYTEYNLQPAGSIWTQSSSNYGSIVYNFTKDIYYLYKDNETGFIFADEFGAGTEFSIDDEIMILFLQ